MADANDTGRTVAARSEGERALLGKVPSLPSGVVTRVGSDSVSAEEPYTAASGRTCRALTITPAASRNATHRLACTDGRTWFFVPDVFGSEGDAGAE